jgi:hypothetical protein
MFCFFSNFHPEMDRGVTNWQPPRDHRVRAIVNGHTQKRRLMDHPSIRPQKRNTKEPDNFGWPPVDY